VNGQKPTGPIGSWALAVYETEIYIISFIYKIIVRFVVFINKSFYYMTLCLGNQG